MEPNDYIFEVAMKQIQDLTKQNIILNSMLLANQNEITKLKAELQEKEIENDR